MIPTFTEDRYADAEAQDAALDTTCPYCSAERDAYCVSRITGQFLHNRISHPQRITAATTLKDST